MPRKKKTSMTKELQKIVADLEAWRARHKVEELGITLIDEGRANRPGGPCLTLAAESWIDPEDREDPQGEDFRVFVSLVYPMGLTWWNACLTDCEELATTLDEEILRDVGALDLDIETYRRQSSERNALKGLVA